MNPIELSTSDLAEVTKTIKIGGSGRVVSRAMALKMKHQNYSNMEVAELLDITPRTVINICNYYQNGGLESALNDDPRPGQPAQVDDRIKSQIVAIVCSDPPEAFDRWTLELIQQEVIKEKVVSKISKEKIRIILHEHDLKPWRYDMWCVPCLDEEFIQRMEDVLDIYERPQSDDTPVVCIDEKPVQLLDDKREGSSVEVGKSRKIDYEYERKGGANVFMAIEPKTGVFHAKVTDNRKGKEFAKYLSQIEKKYSNARKIILVMDNLNIHKEKSLIDFYGEEKGKKLWSRFEVHHTPKHASWLNQAEIAIGMYSQQCLGKRRIGSIEDLRKKTNGWIRAINSKKIKIEWKFNKTNAREKFQYKK
jgi:transposase